MKIKILIRRPLRCWQEKLAAALRDDGHAVFFEVGSGGGRLPRGLALALGVQRRLFGPRSALFARVPLAGSAAERTFDLAIVLNGATPDAERWIAPVFDGATGEAGLLEALARGTPPRVVIRRHAADGACDLVVAHFAVEDRDILSRALDQALARLVTVLRQAVRRAMDPKYPGVPCEAETETAPRRHPLAALGRGMARKLAARFSGAPRGPNHWQIGYRIRGRMTAVETDVCEGLAMLPDDGSRFYADPMPFAHEGRRYIFFEDFPYATGKGIIGCVEILPDGTASSPRTVLEGPVHLSYPFVIDHGEAFFLMPETSAARRLQLFRADRFPDIWTPDRTLLDDIAVADATPVFHDGRWWIFASLSDDGGSSWDQLGLFHAPDLFGPWEPHHDNPVLIDAGAARPAGAMWHEGTTLMRVAQDCRDGYGRGLAICRVDRLDPDGFAQTVISRVSPPAADGADGIHTLNRSASLDVIDLRFPPKPRASSRSPGNRPSDT